MFSSQDAPRVHGRISKIEKMKKREREKMNKKYL